VVLLLATAVASIGATEAENGLPAAGEPKRSTLPKIADTESLAHVTHEQLYWAANTMNFLELDAGSSGAATDTVGPIDSLQKSQAPAQHFNFFGFFGCCYKCKHEPQCTSKCMEAHHIPNGYDEAQEADAEANAAAAKDYKEAAQVLQFIQIAADSAPAADQTTHPGAKSEKAAEDQSDAKKAGVELNQMSSEHQNFDTHKFFNCVFGCHHEIPCSKKCLAKHNIADHYVKHQEDELEEYEAEADAMFGDEGVKQLDL